MAASDFIDRAGDIMQGGKDSDALTLIKQTRYMLACDGLDRPLQEAMQARHDLMKQLDQTDPLSNGDYNRLLDSFRNALSYALSV